MTGRSKFKSRSGVLRTILPPLGLSLIWGLFDPEDGETPSGAGMMRVYCNWQFIHHQTSPIIKLGSSSIIQNH
uniref:Uncharacterized protein n=1 Tax=Timema bartmani TaxID=61472 RepID=A0A7R9I0K6_9NEOP|nr:unnamed protein product [Timema bartmani]